MSSTMARVSRKILIVVGTRVPSSDTTPRVKAMSVAMGMPHPAEAGPDGLKEK